MFVLSSMRSDCNMRIEYTCLHEQQWCVCWWLNPIQSLVKSVRHYTNGKSSVFTQTDRVGALWLFPYRGVLILYISQESQDDCLHMDFECFKLELWPTLRQKFMNFWSFLTCPGDKHDTEKISNCSSTPKRSWSKLTILPWVSRCFNFSHDKTPNLMVFSEISFWNEMFLCSIKTEMSTVAEMWIVSDSPHVNAENRKLQETSRRFCEILVGHLYVL